MITLEDFKHWEEIDKTTRDLKDNIVWYLHDVWEQYYEPRRAFFGNNRFPSLGEDIEISRGENFITVEGTDGYGEDEFCCIPVDIVFGDEESRAKALLVWKQRIKDAQKEAEDHVARLKEEKDRAEYERLQAKFGASQ